MKNDPRSTVNPILCSCIRIRSLKKILGWVVQSRVTITPFVQNFNSHLNANSVLFFLTTICTMATSFFSCVGWRPKPRVASNCKDLTETGNHSNKVSGTQGRWFDALKTIEKIVLKNAFEQKEKNPGLIVYKALISLQTTRPSGLQWGLNPWKRWMR